MLCAYIFVYCGCRDEFGARMRSDLESHAVNETPVLQLRGYGYVASKRHLEIFQIG